MATNESNPQQNDKQLSEKQKQDEKIYTDKSADPGSKPDLESGHDLKARQQPYVETDFQTKGEDRDDQEAGGDTNASGRPVPKMNASPDEGGENESAEEGGKKINKEIPDDQQAS